MRYLSNINIILRRTKNVYERNILSELEFIFINNFIYFQHF